MLAASARKARTEIVSLMLNRDIDEMFPKKAASIGAPVLELKGVSAERAFTDISLTLHRGEILGLTGLLGSGAKELVQSLFGLIRLKGGAIEIEGEPVKISSPPSAVAKKLALVPEDRRAQGVALQMSIRENVTLASLRKFVRFGFLQLGREKAAASELISQVGDSNREPEFTGAGPERRQSTESGAGEMAEPAISALPSGRTHCRCGRGSQGRDLSADWRTSPTRRRHFAFVQRPPGVVRNRRPDLGDVSRPFSRRIQRRQYNQRGAVKLRHGSLNRG